MIKETETPDFESAPDHQKKRRKWLAIIIVAVVLLCVGCWWMIGEMFGYTANARLKTLEGHATAVCKTAALYTAAGNTLSTGTFQIGSGEDPFDAFLQQYNGGELTDLYCALICDADGCVMYVLCSEKPIDTAYLTAPPDRQSQLELMRSHFDSRRKQAVGCYQPESFPKMVEYAREQVQSYRNNKSNRG